MSSRTEFLKKQFRPNCNLVESFFHQGYPYGSDCGNNTAEGSASLSTELIRLESHPLVGRTESPHSLWLEVGRNKKKTYIQERQEN